MKIRVVALIFFLAASPYLRADCTNEQAAPTDCVITDPATSQTQKILQKSGTNLQVNRFEDIRFADQFANIQTAVNDSTSGTVVIPSSYTATDAYSNTTNTVPIIDLRNGVFGVWKVIQTSQNVNDAHGNVIPLGNDLHVQANGAADLHFQNIPTDTRVTSSTSVNSTGVATIVLSLPVGLTSPQFFVGAAVTVERSRTNAETLNPDESDANGCNANPSLSNPSPGFWCPGTDATHIIANFQKTHTFTPYSVDQFGATLLQGWNLKMLDNGGNSLFSAKLDNSGSALISASPSGATESGSTVTITTNGAHGFTSGDTVTVANVAVAGYNGTFTIASVPSASTFTYTDSNTGLANSGGGTATAGMNDLFTFYMQDGTTKWFQSRLDDIPRWFGEQTNGALFFGSSGGTGTNGPFLLEDNTTDNNVRIGLNTSTGSIIAVAGGSPVIGFGTAAGGGLTADSALSRLNSNSLALGNGTAGDDSATLALATLNRKVASGTNAAGSDQTIAGGAGTGNGQPGRAIINGSESDLASGTTTQAQIVRVAVNSVKSLTSGSSTTVLSIPLATHQMTGGWVDYYLEATDGSNQCTLAGNIHYAGENTAGTFVVAPSAATGNNQANSCTSGKTLTATWTLTGANPTLLQVKPTLTGITPTRFTGIFEIHHMGNTSPTL